MSAQDAPPIRSAGSRSATARRLVAVTAEGVASGTPLMVGSKLLQGWLTASGVPLALIGLIPLAELPYTLKLFWAPLLDRWPIAWPDRRRGWLLLMQLILVPVIAAMALLQPSTNPASLTIIGIAALVLAPESIAAVRASLANRPQTAINLALGSALASIALTIPVITLLGALDNVQLALGVPPAKIVLLSLALFVSAITLLPGRTTVLQGYVHLGLFIMFIVIAAVP